MLSSSLSLECTTAPLISPLLLRSAFVQLSDRIKNYRSNKLKLTWPDEGRGGVRGRRGRGGWEGVAKIMWHPSQVCRRLRPFEWSSSWLNVKKEQNNYFPIAQHCYCVNSNKASLSKENEDFTHSYLQAQVKGARHLCLLSIHPHLLPKCSVAHKVLVWNKKCGDDEERLGGDRRDVAKDRHKNKRETEISERKLFRMLSPKINCI